MERHMEHNHKMKRELSGKEFFLKNSLAEYEKPNIYSLEAEFAKTKKNRNFGPYLVFLGFILLLGLSTMAIAEYLEVKSKQISIDISDFEDLRLKEALSAAVETENQLNRKNEELNTMRTSYSSEIRKLKQEIQQKSKNPQDLNNKTQQKNLQAQQKKLTELEKQYQKQITQKQAEIARLEKETKNKTGKDADYHRFYQTELKRQKELYENKIQELKKSRGQENQTSKQRERELLKELEAYQDVFGDQELLDMSSPTVSGGDTLALNAYRKELEQERVLDRASFKTMRSEITQLSQMMKKLRAMPSSHPATPVFKQTNALVNSIINDYERLWSSLTDRISSKNGLLGSYQAALTVYLKDIHASGCVIDPDTRNKMTVFCRKGWEVNEETIVELYRGKDEYIGKIKLIPGSVATWAQVVELAKNKNVKLMDWFEVPVNP
jgi:myosin heavy subunit